MNILDVVPRLAQALLPVSLLAAFVMTPRDAMAQDFGNKGGGTLIAGNSGGTKATGAFTYKINYGDDIYKISELMVKIRDLKDGDETKIRQLLKNEGQEDWIYVLKASQAIANNLGKPMNSKENLAFIEANRHDAKFISILFAMEFGYGTDIRLYASNTSKFSDNGKFNLSLVAGLLPHAINSHDVPFSKTLESADSYYNTYFSSNGVTTDALNRMHNKPGRTEKLQGIIRGFFPADFKTPNLAPGGQQL